MAIVHNGMRHSYLGQMIDAEVVHRQARDRMTDYRGKESSVVHHHAHREPCKDHEHTVYSHLDGSVTPGVYVDDGYAMWQVPDPAVKK